jgi:hypothetical protein
MPWCFGCIPVGAGHEHAEVGVVRAGVPHLLPVDHPLVAVEHGGGGEAGEVAAGADGSLNSWHHTSSPVSSGRRNRSRVTSGPCSRIVGPARPAGTEDTAPARGDLASHHVVGPRRQALAVPALGPRRHRPAGVEQHGCATRRSDSEGSQCARVQARTSARRASAVIEGAIEVRSSTRRSRPGAADGQLPVKLGGRRSAVARTPSRKSSVACRRVCSARSCAIAART